MEKGKRICRTLKELRKRIADANDIPYKIEECPHKGDCPGTCPKCESEVRYLMAAIDKRDKEGKPVIIEGLMNEEELRKVFAIGPIVEYDPKDYEAAGLPLLEPETQCFHEMGSIAEPLMGEPTPYHSYEFASTIANRLLAKIDGNLIFSPAGLSCILEMLRDEMNEQSNLYNEISKLIMYTNSFIDTTNDENFKLEHASSIWYNKRLGAIKEDYIDNIEDSYDAKAYNVDFSQKIKTKLWIDKWVSDNTNKMIKKLDTELSEDALMVVLDAIYMNGKWKNTFEIDQTEVDTFHNSDGTECDVAMMFQEIEDAEYEETDDYQVIKLPYKNSEYSMVVVLPKENRSIESVMATTNWLDFDSDCDDVQLFMPRFDFDNTLSFKNVLSELGLKDMFETEDSLPNITDLPAHISQIKQQCVINVEEEGTEVAAVTMAEYEVGCCPDDDMQPIITMMLNRPFGFAIKGETGQMLFMGVVKNMKGTTI